MAIKRAEVYREAQRLGVYLYTYNPGDDATRYRFSDQGGDDYFSAHALTTCLGPREAMLWLASYRHGKDTIDRALMLTALESAGAHDPNIVGSCDGLTGLSRTGRTRGLRDAAQRIEDTSFSETA